MFNNNWLLFSWWWWIIFDHNFVLHVICFQIFFSSSVFYFPSIQDKSLLYWYHVKIRYWKQERRLLNSNDKKIYEYAIIKQKWDTIKRDIDGKQREDMEEHDELVRNLSESLQTGGTEVHDTHELTCLFDCRKSTDCWSKRYQEINEHILSVREASRRSCLWEAPHHDRWIWFLLNNCIWIPDESQY